MTIDDENGYINECASHRIENIERIFDEAKVRFEEFKAKISKDFSSFDHSSS